MNYSDNDRELAQSLYDSSNFPKRKSRSLTTEPNFYTLRNEIDQDSKGTQGINLSITEVTLTLNVEGKSRKIFKGCWMLWIPGQLTMTKKAQHLLW